MTASDRTISHEDLLLLVNRTGDELRRAKTRQEFLWWEWDSERSSLPKRFLAFDAVLDVFAQSVVRTGPNWQAVMPTLPGVQLILPRVVDSEKETFVEVGLLDVGGEFSLNAGTPHELDVAHEAAAHRMRLVHVFRFPVEPIAALVRRRAAEWDVELPKLLAPPEGSLPAWARPGTADKVVAFGGPAINWQVPAIASSLCTATPVGTA